MVLTVKDHLWKLEDPYLALLTYRDTPGVNGVSPAQLWSGRRLQTRLPRMSQHLEPDWPSSVAVTQRDQTNRWRQAVDFNRRHAAHSLRSLQPATSNRHSQATLDDAKATVLASRPNMAAPASTSPLAPIPPDWPDSGSNDVLRTLFLQCVDGYIANAENDVDWALVARASAEMLVRSRRREPGEWIRFLLWSRATDGEFRQLVRGMRLDDGSDLFRYFRMTRQRSVLNPPQT
ncbi:hypothetical protein ISCGN_004491 [Ixodes scapularis]